MKLRRLAKSILAATSLASVAGMSHGSFEVNYGEALQKSIYFYEAQQSGKLPAWNRVEWRGDSTLNDGADNNVDLSGGWYDAGDHVKFGFPMAATATLLAWGAIEYPEAYSKSGQIKHLKNNLRFVADYFVNAHPEPNVLYGQVGVGSDDHAWWGPVEAVEATPRAASKRPSFAITEDCAGSDLAGETASALAAISMLFKDDDPAYSALLLKHAKELYTFATTHLGVYSDCITDATAFYKSWSGYNDELVWSAIWMHKATGDASYLNDAKKAYNDLSTEQQQDIKSYKWTQAWDDKSYGSYALMAQLTGDEEYKADTERWLDYWTTGYEGNRVPYTDGGLAQVSPWGANRYSANTAFIALIYSDYLKSIDPSNPRVKTYYDFAVGQMEYIMGNNPSGIPFQIGMAENGPKNPHHRTAHGSWQDSLKFPEQSRHLLVGALVGGPGTGDDYEDDRGDYIANEVATDYNAGFTSALARLYLDFGGQAIPESSFPAPEEKDLEYYVEAKVNSSSDRYIEIGSLTHNHTAWPAKVSENLVLRYWVDLSVEKANGYSASDITVSTAYTQASSITQLQAWGAEEDNLYYLDVSFAGVKIFPGGQSASKKEVQFRLSLPTTSQDAHWDNSEDPSWGDYSSEFTVAPNIALYDGTTLVWGQEPGAGCGEGTEINCLPQAQNVSAETNFQTSVEVTLKASDTDGSISSFDIAQAQNGTISLTGNVLTYTPNSEFSGVDSFAYTAIDNQGGISNTADITVVVAEKPLQAILDQDKDGILDDNDNCPTIANPGQWDKDQDNIGNECDLDIDGDGCDNQKEIELGSLPWNENSNACTTPSTDDADKDGIVDSLDNCPKHANPGQWDKDQDNIGNACDSDIDGDGCSNEMELSLGSLPWNKASNACSSPSEGDSDGDSILDQFDNCPSIANPGQWDKDGDKIGNECDNDIDGDGFSNEAEIAAGTKVWDENSFPIN